MAVQEQTPLQEYTANGIAKQFDLEFDCESADHLIVSIDDLEVLHTDWYLSGNAIMFHIAPANGKQVKIQRNTPFNRLADYQSYNNSFRPPAINKDFDRIWWKLQELGVADWILSNRISALKAYVDDKDDELRAYLLEEIRKQGVALDQLDEYYNYLMQRLAQIAMDKGWEASFVVTASGKNLQEVSDLIESQVIRTSNYGLINSPTADQSTSLQAIADLAKAGSKTLIIDSLSDAVYAVMNVDITGLTVEVSPTVSFIAPTTATNQYTFIALGASGNLAPQTILKNAKLDAVGRMRGVFKAEYVNEPHASDCSAINVPTGVSLDGSGISMKECIKPRVKGGFYHGGRNGVLFISCTNPVAEGVETDYQGRDGIIFYTDPAWTTTTDAVSINCKSTRFALNGEMGRAGIHFYGVRRAKAIAPASADDSGQVHDDTAAVRFRDCEDYYTDGYDVENIRTGVVVNEVGDYAGAPHNIIVRGAIGVGNVKNTRKYGVAAATPGRICNIIGATVTNSGQVLSGAGIYSAADGNISGCIVDGTTDAPGIYASGENTITGNTLKNAGRQTYDTAQIIVSGKAVLNGNTFKNTDGTSNLAIRGTGNAELTIGANNYDANISRQLLLNSTATLKRGSSLIKTQFAGLPSLVTGIFENGVQLVDTNGIVYIRESGAWKRQVPRSITATIETSQTTIAHGLGYKPTEINIQVKSNANVWQSAEADTTNIYLTSSVAGAIINVSCR